LIPLCLSRALLAVNANLMRRRFLFSRYLFRSVFLSLPCASIIPSLSLSLSLPSPATTADSCSLLRRGTSLPPHSYSRRVRVTITLSGNQSCRVRIERFAESCFIDSSMNPQVTDIFCKVCYVTEHRISPDFTKWENLTSSLRKLPGRNFQEGRSHRSPAAFRGIPPSERHGRDHRWNNVRPQEWIASRWSIREGTFGVSIPTGKSGQRIPMGAGNHRCTLFVRDVNVFRIRPEGRHSPGPSVVSPHHPAPRQIAALPFILFHSPRT